MVDFNSIPATMLVPGFFAEFDGSKATQGPSIQTYRLLVIGQRITAGTVAELVPTTVTTADQARGYFGAGSMLHGMAKTLFANNRFTSATFVALEDAAGTLATLDVTFSVGTPAAGTIFFYVAGRRLTVTTTTVSTPTTIGDSITAAITADDSLPVTASNALGVVSITAKNDGTIGNTIDWRLNYYDGEALPSGVTVDVAQGTLATGATDPDVSTVWAVLGETHYNVIVNPYSDAASLALVDTELAERWGPTRAIEAVAISAHQDTHANLITYGDALNSKHLSVVGFDKSPTPPYEWAAAIAGLVAGRAQNDPARPFQRMRVAGVLAPWAVDQFTIEERNLLLPDGVATYTVDAGGNVLVERLVTTWQENASGAPDTAFRDLNTVLTLGYLRYDLRTQFLTRYPDHKLANDGTRFGAGQKVLTPKIAKAEVLRIARGWETLALVEDLDTFKNDLIVERNGSDPNRLDLLIPPDLVNQFRVGAASIEFLL